MAAICECPLNGPDRAVHDATPALVVLKGSPVTRTERELHLRELVNITMSARVIEVTAKELGEATQPVYKVEALEWHLTDDD